ncbi:MAG: PAS domain S-box protein [Promethearchaeota archaeon]|nr:MAG: PAS domain S-box protein [Candidatus Lokiarchaeota archaeon]
MLNLRDNSEFVSEDKIVNNNSIGVQSRIRKDYIELGILSLILLATALTSLYSYLLFHTIAELFSIIIAGGIFVIAWNSRKNIDNSFFLVVGISFIFIGFMDLLHTLAYTGMGIFTGYGSNLPTQLWIAARYLQAFSFLYAALVVNKKVNTNDLIIIYTIITSLLIFLIFNRLFPNCYIEGSGLTPFKIISEYIIISILFLTVFIMYKVRKEFNKKIFIFIVVSIVSTMIAELAFTFYVSTYGLSNLIGHLFKMVAFFLLYKAIIEIGLENPFNLLFRKLKRSESSLLEEKRFTETALNSQRDTFFIFDPSTGKALIWNKAFREVSGYSDEEISSMPAPTSYYKEEDLNKAALATENVKKEGKTLVEMNLITKDGKSIPFEYLGTAIKDEKGNPKYIVSVGRDITERKLAVLNLKKSEERYRILIETAQEGIWTIDKDANTTFVNPRMAEILGYTVDEMIGKHLFYFMDAEGKKIAERDLERRKRGIKEQHDFEFLRKDGTRVYARLETSPLVNEEGNYSGAVAFVSDITERKMAEQKIADLARFPSENPNPVIRMTREKVLYTNKPATDLFNIREGSKIPKLYRDILNEVFENNKTEERELEINNRIYYFVITPIKEEGYANIYGRDITDRKRAEQKLEEFVSTVSHELRTPITVLIMSIEYLKNQKQKLTPEVEEKLMEGLSRNITALNELVEDVLTLSKIDEEKLKMDWKEFYPLEVIHEIINLMEPRLKEKQINIEVEVPKGIQLFGDKKIIEEIFRILIDNAIKYSRENSKIEIKAIENYKYIIDSKEFLGVLFQIKDYGRGIRKEDIPNLFKRFFRSEDVKNISGTGLGLSIAKELTQFHDGKIIVESEYGKGSTFSVFFHSNKNKG